TGNPWSQKSQVGLLIPCLMQELIAIAVQQRHVPFHGAAKLAVVVAAYRKVTEENRRELETRPARKRPQQGRLILNGMGGKPRQRNATHIWWRFGTPQKGRQERLRCIS